MFSSKKILAFCAVVIIAAPIFLYLALYVQQKMVQYEMMEKLENASLQCIVLTEGTYRWVKENKEIEIDGRLFDVKDYTQKNGKIYFTGLFDEEEALIKKQMVDFVKKDSKNHLPQQQLLHYLFMPALICNDHGGINRTPIEIKMDYCQFEEKLPLAFQPCFTPPPNS